MSLQPYQLFKVEQSQEILDPNSGLSLDIIRIETRTSALRVDIAPNGRLWIQHVGGGIPLANHVFAKGWVKQLVEEDESFMELLK